MSEKTPISDSFKSRMSDFGFVVKKHKGSSESQKDGELPKQQESLRLP
jgi:hypothetical protein